ncbi:uncharacterized protein LOC114325320 [Diabrotica virgifera virgifera]|uniref:Uncharacterized protein LOC114325320 n=1 Tax=Diabrotica virgifera virgifera TaxID=50390 RepID=A0A6P7F0R4_DIAVI|nr:uncharacterized protein LOC114325320 [Diabrotica virgifera virgifera]
MYKILAISLVLVLSSVAGIHDSNIFHSYQHDVYQGIHNSPLIDGYGDDYQHGAVPGRDQCQIYKVGFTQDLYFQYIQYKTQIPDLKQFTLCYWSKFYNHSNDHPLFSYAVDGQPRAIYSWISNTERSSYFSLSVEGHTFYRLNYPLRLNRWYHTCQSWNGKTGEWQIWVNAERVGRGFHNRLVGHVIPGRGVAITGQEQSQLGGGFQEGAHAPKGSGGMLGEITMVQLYKVALTAGKAHKDHKHHHAHQFDHNGRAITTPAPTTPASRALLPQHPLLTSGQLNKNIRLNFAGGDQPQLVPGQQFDAQFANGQFVGNLVTQQLLQTQQKLQPQPQLQPLPQPQSQLQPQALFLPAPPQSPNNDVGSFSRQYINFGSSPIVDNDFNHALGSNAAPPYDGELETHNVFKRQSSSSSNKKASIKQKKRQTIGGSFFEESILDNRGAAYNFDQSLLYGLAGIGQNEQISEKQKETEDEREPAEAEVKAVLNVCTGCDEEPFEKALIFGWRTVPKKLYSGAFYTPAVSECKVF